MSKETLKKSIIERQNGACALTQAPLNPDTALVDTDRIVAKKDGGIYTDENTRIVDPVAHLKRHDNYRERQYKINRLKTKIDGREKVRKHIISLNNRILAMERGVDELDEQTRDWLKSQLEPAKSYMSKIDYEIKKRIKSIDHKVAQSALGVDGIGPITVAYMLVYIDIHKAEYCSSMWSYVGLDKPSHERYKKGETSGGNRKLRTVLYTMAESQVRTRGAYRDVYDSEKQRLAEGDKSEQYTISRTTKGKLKEMKWKNTKPSHRDGAAKRKVMKHFLSDWWKVHRTIEGLEAKPAYAIQKLGHTNWIEPEERGWVY